MTDDLQDIDLDAARGRGLTIVDQLASSWGVDHDRGLKVVWANIEFPAAEKRVSERSRDPRRR